MAERRYVLEAFAVMAAATFSTRVFPFLVPRRWRANPHLRFMGSQLPPAMMVLLVLYCLKDVSFAARPYGLPELFSLAVVVLLHLWRRNSLLSIGAGTACYIMLVRRFLPWLG